MGINISESMEFLIKTVIERLERNPKILEKDKQSIVLEKKVSNKRKEDCC